MKSTTKGTLAALITCVAAAVGVACATPAAAAATVPVPVPLDGAEKSLGMELPEIRADIPLPAPGAHEGPRYVEGRLLPERTVPQLPLDAGVPGASLHAPLPATLGGASEIVGVDAPASDLRALSPGLEADAPLAPPEPGTSGLPELKLPQAGLAAPVLHGETRPAVG